MNGHRILRWRYSCGSEDILSPVENFLAAAYLELLVSEPLPTRSLQAYLGSLMLSYWLPVVTAVVAVGVFLINNQKSVQTLAHGGLNWSSALFCLLLVGTIPCMAGAHYILLEADKAKATADAGKLTADAAEATRIADADRAREEEHATATKVSLEAIATEQRRLGAVVEEGFLTVSKMQFIASSRCVQHGSLITEDTRTTLYGSDGSEQLVVVTHLFKDSAFWRYDSSTHIDGLNSPTVPFDLMQEIGRSDLLPVFATYDLLVGVGLDSNSTNPVQNMAFERAAVLCGALYGLMAGRSRPTTFGLEIGRYGGAKESKQNQDQRQRAVLIVGVNKTDKTLNHEELVGEILSQVSLNGADLHLYSLLRPGSTEAQPWLETRVCKPGRLVR